ncbi:MAG: prephenate dehydrogenase/arogenate dehydrogenase family protein [Nitrososphaerales archaeon]
MSAITKSILSLVKTRQDLARNIGKIKESMGTPIENVEVEEKLRQHVRSHSSLVGLEDKLALALTDVLIESSKEVQREQIFYRKIASFLRKRKIERILIVGAGRMGGWFASYFRSVGLEVILFDKDENIARKRAQELYCKHGTSIESTANESDLIIVAVPISETNREVSRLEKVLGNSSPQAIIEVSSIKQPIRNYKKVAVPIVSIHPLFGASSEHYEPNTVVLIQDNKRKSNRDFELASGIFPHFKILQMSSKEHDKQMAFMLSLPHILALSFAKVISRNRFQLNDQMQTPSFFALSQLAANVFEENPEVYYEIQSSNEFTPKVLRELVKAIQKLSLCVEQKDRSAFKKFVKSSKNGKKASS